VLASHAHLTGLRESNFDPTSSMETATSTLIRTDQLPAAERFEFWREASFQILGRLDYRTDNRTRFRAELRSRDLGAIRIHRLVTTGFTARRTGRLIRPSDRDMLAVILHLHRTIGVAQGDRQTRFGPGDFAVVETNRPFEVRSVHDEDCYDALMLVFPRALLPLPPSHLKELTAVRLGPDPGVGALTSGVLTQLAANIDHLQPAEGARLATTALEVLATRLAHELDGVAVPPSVHQRALLTRIHAFIQQHLGDPELSPGVIAAANHVSLRYLQKLFQAEGTTVAGWIRACRLDRCRRDLLDPAFQARPVRAVAARWGLVDPRHFTCVFRATYGLPPGEYRRLHLGAAAGRPEGR
jgi:AraC-like DNA-binding protein